MHVSNKTAFTIIAGVLLLVMLVLGAFAMAVRKNNSPSEALSLSREFVIDNKDRFSSPSKRIERSPTTRGQSAEDTQNTVSEQAPEVLKLQEEKSPAQTSQEENTQTLEIVSGKKNTSVTAATERLARTLDLPNTQGIGAGEQQQGLTPVNLLRQELPDFTQKERVDLMIKGIRAQGVQQNYSPEMLDMVEQSIREVMATTTDLEQMFVESVLRASERPPVDFEAIIQNGENAAVPPPNTPLVYPEDIQTQNVLTQITNISLKQVVARMRTQITGTLPHAQDTHLAQTGLLPFGGYVTTTFPCTCTGGAIWKVFTLNPAGIGTAFFDYAIGSQAFAWYSFPYSSAGLGLYEPGVQACWMVAPFSCFLIPGMGFATPIVGSALF